MACDHCRSIDIERLHNKKPWTYFVHHSTFYKLEACCVATGCQLCEWIRSGIEKRFDSSSSSGSEPYGDEQIRYRALNLAPHQTHGFSKIVFEFGHRFSVFFDVFVLEGECSVICFALRRDFSEQLNNSTGSRLANSNIISGRPVSLNSDSENCFRLAKRWRDHCLEHHVDTCLRTVDPKLPTRVIDVGPSDNSREPCLKISEGEKGEWVALSHCWGSESQFVLNSNMMASFKKGMSFQTLPPTFRDAIIVTRKMGYRYLWIDSLCIIQKDHDDWVKESKRMQDYYKNAILTISADSASGDHVGIFSEKRPLPTSLIIELTIGEELGIRKSVEMKSHVSKRAWTLQEFVLSPRSLQYMPDQLIWEFYTSKLCESDTNPQDNEFYAQERNLKRFFSTPFLRLSDYKLIQPSHRWYNLVEDYSLRDMTKKNDILPAISGLAREIAQQSGYTYAAGIWIEEIWRGLAWHSSCSATAKESDEHHAPSWSWAFWPTSPGIEFMMRPGALYADMDEGKATLIRYKINPEDDDKFGRVKSGYIDLRGRGISMRSWLEQNNLIFNYVRDCYDFFTKSASSSDVPGAIEREQTSCFFDSFDENATSEKVSEETFLFSIFTEDDDSTIYTYALLLVQVENSPKETYRRVGLITFWPREGYSMDTWDKKEVHII